MFWAMEKAQLYRGLQQVEISSIDLRYEHCRLKSTVAEKALLSSILDHGIRDPLQGVCPEDGRRVLLDGFKRYRCAKKLSIGVVPFHCLAEDEAFGIVELLRISNAKTLSILEQARLIDELYNIHKMSVSEIALVLERSKAWVSLRVGITRQMSKCVSESIFSGAFPGYSYMYTLRQFMRINSVSK